VKVLTETANTILEKISYAINGLNHSQVEKMLEELLQAWDMKKKVLVVGGGRSGLIGKAFAMRLIHFEFKVYVIGETIVPSIEEGDVVFIISGSGQTRLPITLAEMAKNLGANVIVLTSQPNSPLSKFADLIIEIPGRREIVREKEYLSRQLLGYGEPLDPMGSIFEGSSMIFLDSVIAELVDRLKAQKNDLARIQ